MVRMGAMRRAFAHGLKPLAILALLVLVPDVRADEERVLHEFVPEIDGDDEAGLVLGRDATPEAILYEGELLSAPRGGSLRADERPMVASPDGDGSGRDAPGRRSPTFRPDRITSLEGSLGYFTVFSPSIAPFKRVSALDAVVRSDEGVPVLGVARPNALTPVPVEGAIGPAPDGRPRDRFWGSVVLDFSRGHRVPFPSVSPESRILTLRTEPQADVHIEKDAADNYFAVAPARIGSVRVTFLTDAPREYFNARAIPEVPVDALAEEVFPLEPATAAEALRFARRLGLSRDSDLPEALEALTEHFRSFVESDEPPPDSGNIFRDLAEAQRGVCRHRAYAFVITAQALGLPARFVMNEAHAWVEVKLIDVGWMRIDLGGAANALENHGGSDRPVYRPREADPLPQPEAYRQSYSQLSGSQVQGLRDGEGEAYAEATRYGSEGAAGQGVGPEGEAEAVEEGGGLFSTPAPPQRGRPLRLTVDAPEYEVFRGRSLTVSGRALDPDGHGVEGLRVEVLLRGARERLLGVTVTGRGGTYRTTVGVAQDLEVGEYRLVVRSPGNADYFPAHAR